MASGSESFGRPVATDGDVVVYTPTRTRSGLIIPVKITNKGDRRAIYRVDFRVTGPGGFQATAHIETAVVGLYPGTSWPTELTAEDPGKPVPEHPIVTIEKNAKQELRS
ncbi:hypothetical protein [Streptomyces sp. ISL-100]|uniref:hypothetical protein n=1 Tax=Streptomyces sp. ISL-100 TaxID=2819173 RepID=UPI001BEB4E7C|nr:hypothetical protein [Streptomyces sp. ISL-100]MBT2396195.1 hypothetical protein [Streptomyces sp. ISL-100]